MAASDGLRPITVYLDQAEIDRLNAEARDGGRSGASAQIRYLLAQIRKVQGDK